MTNVTRTMRSMTIKELNDTIEAYVRELQRNAAKHDAENIYTRDLNYAARQDAILRVIEKLEEELERRSEDVICT
jgi:pSer/pThr/pTyr-binding forkhead associated (FHA) protein